jgi:osmotically-inducible protein OsmY
VKGVRRVINRITLLPGDRSDEQIKAEIEEAMLAEPAADLREITIEAREGRIRFTGTLDSFQEKKSCERIAQSVRGVVEVENKIWVKAELRQPDSEIQPEIRTSVTREVWIGRE